MSDSMMVTNDCRISGCPIVQLLGTVDCTHCLQRVTARAQTTVIRSPLPDDIAMRLLQAACDETACDKELPNVNHPNKS